MTEATDVFASMNEEFVVEPIVVRIARGATVEAPHRRGALERHAQPRHVSRGWW